MRLLRYSVTTGKWYTENFHGEQVPFYAILSHAWGPGDEDVTFENVQSPSNFSVSNDKLHFTYSRAAGDGFLYFWVDTCYIKKSDSTEL